MKINNNRKVKGALIGVLALGAVAGTWAFYTSTGTLDNQMKTKSYGDTLTEEFTPDPDWQPGEEVTKEVGVLNTGDYDLVVRVKLDEVWWRDANTNNTLDSGEELISFSSTGNSGADRTKINYTLASGAVQYPFTGAGSGPTDGIINDGTNSDQTVVYKKMLNMNSTATGWTLHTDGWWYYNGKLSSGEATTNLLDSIMLATDADMGKYEVVNYYTYSASLADTSPTEDNTGTSPSTQWVIYSGAVPTPPSGSKVYIRSVSGVSAGLGYADAIYDLYITSQTCQASQAAVTATFPGAPASVVTGWGLPAN